MLTYIYNKDDIEFKKYLQDKTIDIFYFPEGKNSLLENAIIYKEQKIIDLIVNLEMEYRDKGRKDCYQVYFKVS